MNKVTNILQIETAEFQADVKEKTVKWDREWCEYFQYPYANRFFYHMRGPDRKIWVGTDELRKYAPRDFYFTKPFGEYQFETWTSGEDIVGKTILEVGSGPGAFGRVAAKLAKSYVGIDYSPLALHVGRTVSDDNAEYIHISNLDRIRQLRGTFDIAIGRHFFIHQNVDNVRWLLELYNFGLKDGGTAVLDFWLHPVGTVIQDVNILDGMGKIPEEHASCVYYFAPEVIEELVAKAGFEIETTEEVPEVDRRFVRIRKV